MSISQRKLLCLVRGSINIDEFFHVPTVVCPGETLSSTHFERRAGGKGANQASAVAKAGGRVKLVGAVGQDGEHLVRGLEAIGVDVMDVVVDSAEPTGRAIIQLTPEGENCIILHKGANYLLTPPLLSSPLASTSTSTSKELSYTHLLLQNEVPWPATLAYLSHAANIGATAVWNPSPMPHAEQLTTFPWQHLAWLVVNEGEVRALLDALGGGGDRLEDADDGDALEISKRLLQALHAHPRFSASVSIICTLGARGLVALLSSASNGCEAVAEVLHVPSAKLDGPVKDTTGAGDCFTGYFVAGLMEEAGEPGTGDVSVLRALQRAVEAAGLCVQRSGAVESIPLRDEVERQLSL